MLWFIGCWLLCHGSGVQAADVVPAAGSLSDRLLSEEKHFVECLASVYSPGWWINYNDALYFQARNDAQKQQLEAMKTARSRYLALTNPATWHDLAAKVIAGSGIGEAWQKKLLLPLSATNQDLTPTLRRSVRVVPSYTVLRAWANGDALIQDGQAKLFVMDFGRATAGAFGTNALLLREGVKSFASEGTFESVSAYENVALSAEEAAVLERVVAACRKEVASLSQPAASSEAREEFEVCKLRATDSNPYMQFLLAKAYLEGKGTEKDEKLGLEWMRRAAKSGSGDAMSYLEASGLKAP
jgi:hypothetical protein